MAEVTGEIGGQSVELNNAATEATLRQLLTATLAMAQKMGVDAKKQIQMDKELKKFFDELDKTNKGLKESKKQREEEAKAAKNLALAKQREAELAKRSEMITVGLFKGLDTAASSAMEFANKLTGVMSSFANMGSSFTGAASTFSNIPIVGGILSSAFGAIASSAEKLQTSFKTSASVGANFGGSIRDMVANASAAGLTFEQYSQVIQKNGEALALLGGNTTEGAKRLSNLSRTLKSTGLQDDLARLGMTSEDIANGMAQVSGRLTKAGLTRGMSDAALAQTTADYLKNLDAVSRLTGKNKDALQAEADARMADSQYRLMLAKLDPEGAANLEMLMASIPKEHQAGLKEILATGTAVSAEAQAAMYYLNSTGQNAMQLGQTMRATGKLTQEQVFAFDDARRAEMKMQAEQARTGTGMISTLGMFGDAVQQKFTVGIMDAAAETSSLRESQAKQTKELKDSADAAKKHKDSLDPANMVKLQQELAKTSNEFNTLLAAHLPKLQEAFTVLADFVKTYILPAFEFFMSNIKGVTIAVGALVVGLTVLSKTMQALKAYQEFKTLGKERGSLPTNPMFVRDVGSGGGAGAADTNRGKGKTRGIGNIAKGFGAVGAVVGAGMLYSNMSDINEQRERGEITEGEATEAKSGAVGSAVGGAGGAWAGAAAGAAVGSVVPVVGTVIGGAIGAALGGWLGSKGGEIAGKELNKAVAAAPKTGSEDWMKINDKNINSWVDAVHEGRQKIESVPGVYLPYVNERLAKKPAKTTSSSAGGSPTAVSSINYGAGAEDLLKQFAKQNSAVEAAPKNQTASTQSAVNDARRSIVAQTEQQKEDAAKAKVEAAKEDGKPRTTQESAQSLLAQLNSSMSQLIKISQEQKDIGERQLTVQRSLSKDLFVAV